MPKAKPKHPLLSRSLPEWLSNNDIRLFVERTRLRDAKKAYNEQTDKPVSAKEFRLAVTEHCRYWKCARRWRQHRSGLLSEQQWDDIKRVIENLADDLRGQGLNVAVEIARTRISCCKSILLGLPTRLKVWAETP